MIFALMGCKKIDKLTQFNMEYNENVVIPASTGVNLPFNITTDDRKTNSAYTFSVNDTRKDMIEEIKLTTLEADITSPTNSDFGFLKEIRVYISAEGLSETEIAWLDHVPANAGKHINLMVSNADLKEYIKKDEFSLRIQAKTDQNLSADQHIKIHSVFFVDAKVLGI
jgi:hypothetical protein